MHIELQGVILLRYAIEKPMRCYVTRIIHYVGIASLGAPLFLATQIWATQYLKYDQYYQ